MLSKQKHVFPLVLIGLKPFLLLSWASFTSEFCIVFVTNPIFMSLDRNTFITPQRTRCSAELGIGRKTKTSFSLTWRYCTKRKHVLPSTQSADKNVYLIAFIRGLFYEFDLPQLQIGKDPCSFFLLLFLIIKAKFDLKSRTGPVIRFLVFFI